MSQAGGKRTIPKVFDRFSDRFVRKLIEKADCKLKRFTARAGMRRLNSAAAKGNPGPAPARIRHFDL
jgi:hypothetical protein